jgi:diaminopimelate decarboxylase
MTAAQAIDDRSRVVRVLEAQGAPTLVYDRDGVRAEVELVMSHLRAAIGPGRSCGIRFSIKANAHDGFLRWLGSLGIGAEVSSMAEFDRARAAEVEHISATSPGLSAGDVRRLHEAGVELNVDNLTQLDALPAGAALGLRLCMPLESAAKRHDSHSRFGVDLESAALHDALRAGRYRVVRVHGHARDIGRGAQLEAHARRLVAVAAMFPGVRTINLGGGMTRLYADPATAAAAWQDCAAIFEALPGDAQILIEPGAQLVTRHGYLGTRVVSVTARRDGRQIVTVDASSWNLVSWSKIELIASEPVDGVVSDVVGPTCYENDVWLAGVRLPRLHVGQQLVFRGLGAYVASMAKQMHGLPIPREILL